MSNPMQKSLQGTSQFVNFQASMQKSMCGSSQKIPIQNASVINRVERQRDIKAFKQLKGNKSIKQQQAEQENQFLNVSKWKKQKQSSIHKGLSSEKQKLKQPEQKQKAIQPHPLQQPPTSKWQKKKSNEQSHRSSQSLKNNQVDKNNHIHHQHQPGKVQIKPMGQPQQLIEDDVEENEQNEDESQQQEQQQQEEQQEQQQDSEQQQEQDEDEEEEEQDEQQEEEEQEEQSQEKTKGETNSQSQQSSHAYKTQSVNTSALKQTTKPSKWSKKRTPLETMTKYETKQCNQGQSDRFYHSRLNSGTHFKKQQEQYIAQDIQPENLQEWQKVQKILFRLKLLLS